MLKSRPSLFCVTVIDATDTSIGNSCLKDKERVTNFCKKLSDFIDLSYTPIEIEKDNYTINGLKNAIDAIDAASNDVVIFIYSGHGFSYRDDDANAFPQLALWEGDAPTIEALRTNSINLEEVFNLIVAKGARLNIVFSDCCNTFVELPRFDNNLPFPPWPTTWNHRLATELFIDTKGSYLISAASKGQFAASNNKEGGFFTFSFFRAIELAIVLGSFASSWSLIIKDADRWAKQRSMEAICDTEVCNQDVLCKVLETIL
jgi:hypothetical protein